MNLFVYLYDFLELEIVVYLILIQKIFSITKHILSYCMAIFNLKKRASERQGNVYE